MFHASPLATLHCCRLPPWRHSGGGTGGGGSLTHATRRFTNGLLRNVLLLPLAPFTLLKDHATDRLLHCVNICTELRGIIPPTPHLRCEVEATSDASYLTSDTLR